MNPSRLNALWTLIGINVAVYALWHTWGVDHPQVMVDQFLVAPQEALHRPWTLLTSAFSHIDPGHLLFNMLALYVFGAPVMMVIGERRFVGLYVVGGLLGSVGHVLWGLATGQDAPALGASGAVMAVAVPFGVWFPRQVLLLGFFIPVPAWLAVILFIGLDVLGLFGSSPLDGDQAVAHAAHLGGAVAGLAVAVWGWVRMRQAAARRRS